MPLHRRVPKRGFTNIFRVEYDIVNLADLERFEAGAAVKPETLVRGAARAQEPAGQDPGRRRDPEGADRVGAQVLGGGEGRDRGGRRPLRGAVPLSALQSFAQHLQRAGPAQAGPVHVPAARGLPPGRAHPDAGRRSAGDQRVLQGVGGLDLRLPRHLLGRRAAAALGLRARDHAVHLELDHPAAADGRLALPREALQGRRDGPRRRSPSTPATARCCCRSSRRPASRCGSRSRRRRAARRWCRIRAGASAS